MAAANVDVAQLAEVAIQSDKADIHGNVKAGDKYGAALNKVNDTTKSVDNIATLFSDPRKVLGFLFVVVLLILVYYFLLRAPIKKVWESITAPFKKVKEKVEVNNEVENSRINPVAQLSTTGQAESTDKQLTHNDAKRIAENIRNCWGWLTDHEDIVISQIRLIPGPESFRLVDTYYQKERRKYQNSIVDWIYTTDLFTDIANNMDGDNLKLVISIFEDNNIDASRLESYV